MSFRRTITKWFGFVFLLSIFSVNLALASDEITSAAELETVFSSLADLTHTFFPIMIGISIFAFVTNMIISNSFNPVFLVMPIGMFMMNSMVDTMFEPPTGSSSTSTAEAGIESDPMGGVIVFVIILIVIAGISAFLWFNRESDRGIDRAVRSNASELGDLEQLVQNSVNEAATEPASRTGGRTESNTESAVKPKSKAKKSNIPTVEIEVEEAPISTVRKISLD